MSGSLAVLLLAACNQGVSRLLLKAAVPLWCTDTHTHSKLAVCMHANKIIHGLLYIDTHSSSRTEMCHTCARTHMPYPRVLGCCLSRLSIRLLLQLHA